MKSCFPYCVSSENWGGAGETKLAFDTSYQAFSTSTFLQCNAKPGDREGLGKRLCYSYSTVSRVYGSKQTVTGHSPRARFVYKLCYIATVICVCILPDSLLLLL